MIAGGVVSEEAKAVQEAAKAAREYRSEVRDAGKFIADIFGYPLTQIGGVVGDSIAALRMEGRIRFAARARSLMEERGLEVPTKAISLAVGISIFEAASIEDDETLSSMFAGLLVSSIDEKAPHVSKAIVEAVRLMSPLEAKILLAMVNAPTQAKAPGGHMLICGLPDTYFDPPSAANQELAKKIPNDVRLAVASLTASGCISPMPVLAGTILGVAAVSHFGHALIEATRSRK